MGQGQYACTLEYIEQKLGAARGRTLGEVDVAHVFDITKDKPKVTGIAGDVIEQSVIGYPPNTNQDPDLLVDGDEWELKTTAIRASKRGKGYEAKEPMSITAVSIGTIEGESFFSSAFWHKVERLLIVYYVYDSETVVPAAEYARFMIAGHQFHTFSKDDVVILQRDWEMVHDYLVNVMRDYPDPEERKERYALLGRSLRSRLMYIDTAPKYPHPPRFRLKRSVVSAMAEESFGAGYERLPRAITTLDDVDRLLAECTQRFAGKTLGQIADELGIEFGGKSSAEQVVCKMLGLDTKKLSKVGLFAKAGLLGKTITTTKSGARTEDMKLFTIDFDEFERVDEFEDSQFYEYFADHQLLCIHFEEPSKEAPLSENVFRGFKRMPFDDVLVEVEVRRVWEDIRDKVVNGTLVERPVISKKTGEPRINKAGTVMTTVNFPKSKDGPVFVRGTSSDSTNKPLVVNGISMYYQQIWIKGSYVAEKLLDIRLV